MKKRSHSVRARAKLEPVTPSNPPHDTKYTGHKVAEVSVEVTNTAQKLLLVMQERPGHAWVLMCRCLCAPASKAMKMIRRQAGNGGTGRWVGETEE